MSTTSVTAIGPQRASRPEGCPIDLFPTKPPPYAFTPIAKVRTECDPVRRQMCVDQLRREACRAGADAVIGFKESMDQDSVSMFIDATFVVKGTGAAEAPAAPAAAAPAPGGCDPICSPGFACQGGTCVPQCNPPCEAGEICSRKRVCEPADQPTAPAAPAQ
jgi:hypothetical protein